MNSIKNQEIKDFIKKLSSKSSTPGGGTAAALTGSLAASLVEMVANLTVDKKGYEEIKEEIKAIKKEASLYKVKLLDLADKDAEAFQEVMASYRLKTNDKEKKVEKALKKATQIPLTTAKIANKVKILAHKVAKIGNKNATSDAKSAIHLANAAILSALENTKVNLSFMKEAKYKTSVYREIEKLGL